MQDYPNSGIMFPNHRKSDPRHPDYQGQCKIAGVPLRVSAWKRKGVKGEFITLAFKPDDEQKPPVERPAKPVHTEETIPF